jgi:hypothetical protein
MSPEAQRIAIAEACGLSTFPLNATWGRGLCERDDGTPTTLPDYPNDLNAMHEAELAVFGNDWDEALWATYKYALYGVIEMNRHVINSTAAQRAEALLRTLGKWEDSA